MDDYKSRILLACLAVIVRRSGKSIVVADEDVEAMLDNQTEVMYERDHRARCIQLTVPLEVQP